MFFPSKIEEYEEDDELTHRFVELGWMNGGARKPRACSRFGTEDDPPGQVGRLPEATAVEKAADSADSYAERKAGGDPVADLPSIQALFPDEIEGSGKGKSRPTSR